METYFPLEWKSLNLHKYEGTIDLDENIHIYTTQKPPSNIDDLRAQHELGRGKHRRDKESRGPKYNYYTPLDDNIAKILEEACNAKLIPLPPYSKPLERTNCSKHYQYHHNFGHMIEGCLNLRDRTEELI
ncbi:hypothetical protein CR513_50564, partial [Mucuna pruriens]